MPDFFSHPSFWVAGLLAVILCGLSKGGFTGIAMLATPILSLALPPLQAAAILLPVLMVQDVFGILSFRREFDREGLIVLGVGSVIGITVATVFAKVLPIAALTLLLGVIALVFGAQWWIRRWRGVVEGPPKRAPKPAGVFWGAMCGVTSFIAHVGAPPAQVYLMPLKLTPAVFAGTMTWLFWGINIIKLGPYIALGMLTKETLIASAALVPVAAASIVIGIRIVRIMPAARFYPIIYSLLLIAGAKLCWDGIAGLMRI
ncbi:sulfite exporter TauE/SafE family protein [Terrarubrum flagellatum]|uniref:sulfite exporter TauE/SafE family protein n=1 Tax=Terrirubrum flagellatum TaxID=2895980 RepID=UPI00314561A4